MAGQKILVLGATGHIGKPLVRELILMGRDVRAASRSGRSFDGAEGVMFQLEDPDTIEPALDGVGAVHIMLPTFHFFNTDANLSLLHRVARHGAKIVLQTSIECLRDEHNLDRPAELLVRTLGVPFVIVRPGWFMDNFHIFFYREVMRGELTLPIGNAKLAFIDARDIAASAAAALTDQRFDGGEFNLTGATAIDYAEAARTLSGALGRAITYRPVSEQEYCDILIEAGFSSEDARFFAFAMTPVREGAASAIYSGVQELTGRVPRDFSAWATENTWRFARIIPETPKLV